MRRLSVVDPLQSAEVNALLPIFDPVFKAIAVRPVPLLNASTDRQAHMHEEGEMCVHAHSNPLTHMLVFALFMCV